MYRFFVNERLNNRFKLDKEVLNHIKAIRLKKNENFYCIFEEKYFLCHLENEWAVIDKEDNIEHEFKHDVVLYACLINIKRFEWLIQKATELGVKKIYPVISKNTNKKYVDQFKLKRMIEISKNASEQSFRNIIVEINEPIYFEDAIKNEQIDHKFIAHEKEELSESSVHLFEGDIAFFVGPEGGFTDEEIEIAKKSDTKVVSLGKRILRAETASIYLLSRIKINN